MRLRLAAALLMSLFLLGCAGGYPPGDPLPSGDAECAKPKPAPVETDGGLGGTGHSPGAPDEECIAPFQ